MTQARFKIKKGDFVMVMKGQDRGKKGVVQKVLLDEAKVIVEGVRSVVRHIRPSQANPNGQISKNLPVHISTVALVDPETETISRVGYRFNAEGKKERYFKKSGQTVEEPKYK